MPAMGITEKKIDINIRFTKSGKQEVTRTETELKNLTQATQTYQTTVRNTNGRVIAVRNTHAEYIPTIQQTTSSMQAMNMSVLGINMSLLGFTFALQASGLATKEQQQALMRVIGPLQMTMSLVNLSGSLWQLYALNKQQAAMADIIWSKRMAAGNMSLAGTFQYLSTQINIVWAAIGALGLIYAGLQTKSKGLRAALWALAGVLGALALKNIALAASRIISSSFMGPAGWAKVAIGAGVAGAGIGALAALVSSAKGISLFKGGIIPQTTVTMGDLGPEAVIPLDSERGRNSLRNAVGGTGKTVINNYINADRPSVMYRKMNVAMRRKRYVTA